MANLANCKISLQDAMDYREDLRQMRRTIPFLKATVL